MLFQINKAGVNKLFIINCFTKKVSNGQNGMSTGMITSKSKLMLINQVVFSGKIRYALENYFFKKFTYTRQQTNWTVFIGFSFVAIFKQWQNF